jgi:hypothetical protein
MIPSTVSTTNQIKQKSNVRSDEIVPKDSWKISPSHKISYNLLVIPYNTARSFGNSISEITIFYTIFAWSDKILPSSYPN